MKACHPPGRSGSLNFVKPPNYRSGQSAGVLMTITLMSGLAGPATSWAGMPSFQLTDLAAARLDVISFFLMTYLVLTLLFKVIWNSLAKDFKWMPPLTYKRALGLMVVCGMFLYVVLTMISGARELMTPGAWQKEGLTYRITEPEKQAKPWIDSARRQSMERLRTALFEYAKTHNGEFPPHVEAEDFPRELWRGIDPARTPYGYYPGRKAEQGDLIVAFEPYVYGSRRYVLLSSGEIINLPLTELADRARKELENFAQQVARP